MKSGERSVLFRRIGLGSAAGLCLYLLLLVLFSALTVRGVLAEESMQKAVWASAAIAAFFASFLAKEGKTPLLAGLCFWCMLAIGGLVSGCGFAGGELLRRLLPVGIGTLCAYLLRRGKKTTHKTHRRRRR